MRNAELQMGARPVVKVIHGQAASDGAGVRLTRVIGTHALPNLDPFLLLDEFRSDDANDYLAGFPDHPHRGFETVTYMLAGRMRHGDNHGNVGLLKPGSVQWMTAGRGIVHSEMPEQEEGLMWGFQLWVNLPAKDKMTAPRYQDIAPEKIPEVEAGQGAQVRIIAGSFNEVAGPVQAIATEPLYLDVKLASTSSFTAQVPRSHNAFVYVYEGEVISGGKRLARGQLGVLGAGDSVVLTTDEDAARVILVAGRPLNEPIARHGPFVMNTGDEIRQAIEDFRSGRF
jgi:redox-sensitive bicupin YhaK (pirin superfamily)